MKNFLLSAACLFIFFLLAPRDVAAQNVPVKETLSSVGPFLSQFPLIANSRRLYLNDIRTKAMRHFIFTYKTVSAEKWYRLESGFMATFSSANIKYAVLYDSKGTWRRTIRSYDENKLPVDVRTMVKSDYYDHAITFVEEIQAFDNIFYFICLKGKNSSINVCIWNGEIQVLDQNSGN